MYRGCYGDSQNRDLPHLGFNSNSLTVEDCISYCERKGFIYSGLQVKNTFSLIGKLPK